MVCLVLVVMGLTVVMVVLLAGLVMVALAVLGWITLPVVRVVLAVRAACLLVMAAMVGRVVRRLMLRVRAALVVRVGIPACWGGVMVVSVGAVVMVVRPVWVVTVAAADPRGRFPR